MVLEYNLSGTLWGEVKSTLLANSVSYLPIAFFMGLDLKQIKVNKKTELCIEGYPSSANSYSVMIIKYFNKDIKIASHSHAIANLKKALKYDIPTVILIRHPETVISSRLARHKGNINEYFVRYLRFHEFVLKHLDKFVVLSFKEVINDPNLLVNTVEKHLKLFVSDSKKDNKEIDANVKKMINNSFNEKKQEVTVLPTAEKEAIKRTVKEKVISYPKYNDAVQLFDHILLKRRNRN